jgi:hypothetical protein
MVAVPIFSAGAGFFLLEGIDKILHPWAVDHVLVNCGAIAIAFPLEAAPWVISLQKLVRDRGGHGRLETARRGKDPTAFAVLFEDTAALLGLIAAALGIWLTVLGQNDVPEPPIAGSRSAISMNLRTSDNCRRVCRVP